jgi:uncharacterized membrane protein YccC
MEILPVSKSIESYERMNETLLIESRRVFLGMSEEELGVLERFCRSSGAMADVDSALRGLKASLRVTLEHAKQCTSETNKSERLRCIEESLFNTLETLQQALNNVADDFEACLAVSLENSDGSEEPCSMH